MRAPVLVSLLLALAPLAHAQTPAPLPAPRDVAYPGVIRLEVDVTDIARRVFKVRETIPVAGPGRLTLLYPEWLPGNHAPRGPLDKLSGLVIRAGGRTIPWARDPLRVYAFHIEVPPGVSQVEAEFLFTTPTAPNQGRVVVTPEMLNLQWNAVVLYPAGHYSRGIQVEPSVKLPVGWRFGTALETVADQGGITRFRPVDLDTLVDSPMFAGRHHRQVNLDPGGRRPVMLEIVADSAGALAATEEQIERHRDLVRQADRLFGSRPYDRYSFLLALTTRLGGIGLEHHRSSENSVPPDYFTDWAGNAYERDLLPHEYTHSWNGKQRRPADLNTPTFDTPMGDSLLWVYEGQTNYWGYLLSARSGLLTRDEALEALAATAATYENRVGRRWRPLQDTTYDPIIAARRPHPWSSWQRSEDYYSEGQLIWLDADTLIRELSNGRRSLDDFAKAFFGGTDGDFSVRPYTLADVVSALNAVQPYDWAGFLKTRVEDLAPKAPLDGLTRGGWRLVYTEEPTSYYRAAEASARNTNLIYSLGLALNSEGEITSVLWDSPAFEAGLTVGQRIMAVGGLAYTSDRLKSAITDGKGGLPIELLVRGGDHFRAVSINYVEGLRYPRLERIPGTPDRLTAIYAPRR